MNRPLECEVFSLRLDAHRSFATAKCAEVALDTDPAGRPDAMNPAELLHEDLRRYGTVFNTLAAGCELVGELRRGRPGDGGAR